MKAIDKWLAYYRPMLRGRFAYETSRNIQFANVLNCGTVLFGGRFWQRIGGGYNLYRRIAGTRDDWVFVGRADGGSASANTMPMVTHDPSTAYEYRLTVVGAGGVENIQSAPTKIVTFDNNGALATSAPNPVTDLIARPGTNGTFVLRWRYDETDQAGKPIHFEIYNDAEKPGTIDLITAVGQTPYRFRRGFFSFTSSSFAHGSQVGWQVRAVAANGDRGGLSEAGVAVAISEVPDSGTRIVS